MAFTTTPKNNNEPSIQNNIFRAEIYQARREREGFYTNSPPAYPSNVHTIHDSSNNRHNRQLRRLCPAAVGCWPGLALDAFNPFNCQGNGQELARRLCMIGVLAIRTAISILWFFVRLIRADIANLIVNTIIGVLGFFFVAWCLKEIGKMSGYRRVLGKLVGRWHYDVFLLANLVIHVGILLAVVFKTPGAATGTLWLAMWLAMFVAAWIATWSPEVSESGGLFV
jgi:hypothetical protein